MEYVESDDGDDGTVEVEAEEEEGSTESEISLDSGSSVNSLNTLLTSICWNNVDKRRRRSFRICTNRRMKLALETADTEKEALLIGLSNDSINGDATASMSVDATSFDAEDNDFTR